MNAAATFFSEWYVLLRVIFPFDLGAAILTTLIA